jgi:HEAT repeat protein
LGNFSEETGRAGKPGKSMNAREGFWEAASASNQSDGRARGDAMRRWAWALLITIPLIWQTNAEAQLGLFSKKPKIPPAQRVPELILQAKTDPDEHKRVVAVEELREFDTKTFLEIVPVLVDVARSDAKASVRLEAINSLARIRPVSQQAGQTLEWAAAHDDSWKVRWQAKSSLMRYGWAGYHAGKNENTGAVPQRPVTQEPPVNNSRGNPPASPPPATTAGRTATRILPPQGPPPVIVNQPSVGASDLGPPTGPPPLIVDAPAIAPPAAVGPAPAPKTSAPPVVVAAPAAKTSSAPKWVVPTAEVPIPVPPPQAAPKAPSVPTAAPRPNPAEPNFRPAGQAAPSPSNSVPPVPLPPPPTKTGDAPPTLTPPM